LAADTNFTTCLTPDTSFTNLLTTSSLYPYVGKRSLEHELCFRCLSLHTMLRLSSVVTVILVATLSLDVLASDQNYCFYFWTIYISNIAARGTSPFYLRSRVSNQIACRLFTFLCTSRSVFWYWMPFNLLPIPWPLLG